MTGLGVAEDDSMAFQWFEKAAEQGHADAQCQLGVCYLRGDGVEKNSAKAIEWCKKAMQNGSSSAEAIAGIKGSEKYGSSGFLVAEIDRQLRKEAGMSKIHACSIPELKHN